MKKMAAILAVLTLSVPVFATQASAQQSFLPSWTGWYTGASGGYGFGSNQFHLDDASAGAVQRTDFVSHSLDGRLNGALGGVQFGKNWQQGKFVYGFESDFSYTGIGDTVAGPILLPGFDFQTTHTEKLNWFGTLRARAGVMVSERALVFLTGGLAYGQAELSTFARTPLPCVGTNFCVTGNSSEWRAGWTLGGGWEYALMPGWSMKFEYLYYDLGKIGNTVLDINPSFFLPAPGGSAGVDVYHGSARINGNIVRVGLNFQFNTQ